ncbi:MAG: hypothetical protein CMM02_16535 [Rhodopirellula sp.]|nr:hypothetical protein [Rhodopirellula sp.]
MNVLNRFKSLMIKSGILSIWLLTLAVTSLPADDTKIFNGDWEVAVAVIEGSAVPADFNKMIQLKMRGKQYMTSRMGEVVDEGTFILEEDTKPAKIEITGVKGENAGKKILGIYKLEGRDKLTICYSLEGKAYPEKFDGKGPGMVLITYSRKKVK